MDKRSICASCSSVSLPPAAAGEDWAGRGGSRGGLVPAWGGPSWGWTPEPSGCPMRTATCWDHSMPFSPLLPIFCFFSINQHFWKKKRKKEKEEGKKGTKRFSGQEQAQGDGARGSVVAAFGPLFICSQIAFVKERRSRSPCHLSPRLLSFYANQRR